MVDAAKQALTVFEYHGKTEQREAFYSFKSEVICTGNQIYEALSDMMREKLQMDEDSEYDFVRTALQNIVDNGDDDADADTLQEMVPEWADSDTDVYTSDLTEWIGRSNYNVCYLDDALKEHQPDDGFKALQMAQYAAREEAYSQTIKVLESLVDEHPDEDGMDGS